MSLCGQYDALENGMFGYDRRRRGDFFRSLYEQTLADAKGYWLNYGLNGYQAFTRRVYAMAKREKINSDDILFKTEYNEKCQASPENAP